MEKPSLEQKIMSSPRHVDIEITSRCNLRCKYCYFFNNDDHAFVDLPTDVWLRFFRELNELHVMDVTLAGGEPFIRDDLPELITSIAANRMRFTILSNGGLIDEDKALFIGSTGRCDSVQISVDGCTPESHDSFRGKGSFEQAVRGIRNLQKYNVTVDVRFTLHHRNIHEIRETTEFLLNTLGLQFFSVNNAGYFGSCQSFADEIQLTVKDREKAMRELLELSEKYPGRLLASAGPLANAKMWRSMISKRDANALQSAGTLSACGCMFSKLGILSDGSIVPCNLLPHVKLGNIQSDSIRQVWQGSPLLTELRMRSKISLKQFDMCRDCDFNIYCTGNCPGLAYPLTGQVNHPSPDACLRKFLDSGGIVP